MAVPMPRDGDLAVMVRVPPNAASNGEVSY
jgi:hypothetical protein